MILSKFEHERAREAHERVRGRECVVGVGATSSSVGFNLIGRRMDPPRTTGVTRLGFFALVGTVTIAVWSSCVRGPWRQRSSANLYGSHTQGTTSQYRW